MSDLDAGSMRQRIRGGTFSAAIATALLLYFGYGTTFLSTDSWASQTGALILECTLKLGGWAMAVAALCLLTGARPALMVDAAAAGLVGAGFVVGGLLWLPSAGLSAVLYVIIGAFFLHSAWSNGLTYVAYRKTAPGYKTDITPGASSVHNELPPDLGAQRSLAVDLMARRSEPVAPEHAPDAAEEPGSPVPAASDDQPPPDGYLASFADVDDSPDQK